MVARHVRVTGRVQGVFFRAWAKGLADELGIRGWIRNCDDGSVEALVEGDALIVEDLVSRLRAGPPGARVEELHTEAIAAQNFAGFEIRR